jgi:hypothetical protein
MVDYPGANVSEVLITVDNHDPQPASKPTRGKSISRVFLGKKPFSLNAS